MRKFFTVILSIIFVCALIAKTNLSGIISADSTLTLSGSPYVVTGNVTVNHGITLTVDSAVIVYFTTNTNLYILGTMNAGNATFTSSADTAGGLPHSGDWGLIQIGDYSNAGSVTLDTCNVKYGSNGTSALLYMYNGSLTLNTVLVSNSVHDAIGAGGGTIILNNSNISNSSGNGVSFNQGVNITITNSNIQSTTWPVVYNGTASLIFNGVNVISNNTHNGILMNFGSTSGSLTLDTINVPYVFGDFTVNTGNTLTIAPSDVLKFNGGHLNINGSLHAVALAGQEIYFTSYKNDNLFGDTNGDGANSAPAAQDWYGVVFNDASVDSTCIMTRCTVSFAGAGNTGGITTTNASPTVDSCSISNCYYGAMIQGLSNPIFTSDTVGASQMVPFALSFEANPIFTNNTFSFSDNQYDAIGLLGGTLLGNAVLPIRSVTSIPNVTYLMLNSVTIPAGMNLTINKGVVIKAFNNYQRFIVKGKLTAVGSADSAIVFTSAKDDNFGHPGDTNKDGTQSVPVIGDWGGITFETGSDSTSRLSHCLIQYGSQPNSYYYNGIYLSGGEITTINASPTIDSCSIKDMNYGIYAFSSSRPKIINDTLVNSTSTPIAMSVAADPVFTNIAFANSKITALGIIGENEPTNGEIKVRNVAGYNNITYVLLGDLNINSGTDVIIDPGIVIKSGGPGIYVNGGLRAKGTIAGGEIVFTSLMDDNFGNPFDTNGDGNATSPSPGNWSTIRFQGTSDDVFSLLDSCLIKFGGGSSWGGVTYTDAGSTISNSTISDSYNYGIRCEGSATPNAVNVTFQNCRLDPIAMSLVSNPTFTNITFAANGSKGIRILEGTLSSNATLNQRNVAGINNIAYIIDNLTIASNAILTIEPGVVIKFTNYYNGINVHGAIVADGTATNKVVFTSIKDDSNGGDTNNDGNGTAPGKGDWSTIDFNASNLDSLNSFKDCVFRYGGSGYNSYNYTYGLIRVFNSTVNVDSCTIEQSATSGFGIFGSAHPVISNSQIDNISSTPIAMSMFSNPAFTNITSLNVGLMALGIIPENYSVNAAIPIRNFAGYNNITYYLFGTCSINSGTAIAFPAGLVFKGGSIIVNGAIIVQGTPSQKVVFTDLSDDSFGNPGDTNQNGTATSPGKQGGSRISFGDVSIDSLSIIDNAVFRYTDVAINLTQASPRIINSKFDSDNWGVYLTGVSNPSIDSCSFHNLTYAPIRISLVSYPSSTVADSISGTTFKALGVLDNETLVQDVTLIKRNFAGINNIPYLFAHYTVASNAILTISPGVILKFFGGTGLDINKGLMAIGGSSPDSTVVFTDFRDDYYGGDSNSDSTASNPYSYYAGWNGITFEDQSLDPDCQLNHCIIRYAGISYSGSAITTNNASPTIINTTLMYNNYGVTANGASNPLINYCDIYKNVNYGVNNVNKSYTIDATNNWWGDNSGPTISTNPGGTGQSITAGVNYSPWLQNGALHPIAGDVSLNGIVQAFDASLVLKYVVNPHGADSLNALQQQVGDVSGNGSITAYDASLILQYTVGLISTFPVEISPKASQPDNKTKQYLALQKVNNVQLEVGGGSADFGKNITLPVYLSNTNGVVSIQLKLKYETTLMTLDNISLGSNYSDFNLNYYSDPKTGELSIAIAGTKPMNSDGNVLNLVFNISKDAKGIASTKLDLNQFIANETDYSKSISTQSIEIIGKPTAYQLSQNYPNPFNPSTIISYDVPDNNVPVSLIIYNIQGQEVKTLINSVQNAGRYKITWDGTNNLGERVSSGIYIYRLQANKFVGVKKLVLLK